MDVIDTGPMETARTRARIVDVAFSDGASWVPDKSQFLVAPSGQALSRGRGRLVVKVSQELEPYLRHALEEWGAYEGVAVEIQTFDEANPANVLSAYRSWDVVVGSNTALSLNGVGPFANLRHSGIDVRGNYTSDTLAQTAFNGELILLPFARGGHQLLFYRKDLMPAAPVTWQDLASHPLTPRHPYAVQFPASYKTLIPLLQGRGGVFSHLGFQGLTIENIQSSLEVVYPFVAEKKAPQPQAGEPDYFLNNQAAAILAGSEKLPAYYKQHGTRLGIASGFYAGENPELRPSVSTYNIGVSKVAAQSKQTAVASLILFLLQPEIQLFMLRDYGFYPIVPLGDSAEKPFSSDEGLNALLKESFALLLGGLVVPNNAHINQHISVLKTAMEVGMAEGS